MYRIYNRKIRFFDLRLGYGPKIEQIFIFYFLKIVRLLRLFRQDIARVGSRNVPRPWKPLRAGLGDIKSSEPAIPGPARSYLVLLYSGGGNLPYNSGSSYVNNSVQKLVGEDIRVVLGFLPGAGPMPHPPCTAFITGKFVFLIFGWVMDLKWSKISFFIF
jgi:hypothetical protein